MLDLEAIADQVRTAVAELQQLDDKKASIRRAADVEIADLDQRAEPLRAFVEGARPLLNTAQQEEFDAWAFSDDADDGPRGVDAVLKVMGESPDRVWTVGDLAGVIADRGWADVKSLDNLANATRTNVLRAMAKHNAVHRVGHGAYMYGPDPKSNGGMFDQ